MRGDSHDRACTVGHQDVIRDPDRDFFIVDRIDGICASENSCLLRLCGPINITFALHLLDVCLDLCRLLVGCQFAYQRMLRGHDHVCRAEQRVRTSCENVQGMLGAIGRDRGEVDLSAFGPADPVGLHRFDFFRPIEFLQPVEQAVGISCYAKHPLIEFFLRNLCTATLAAPVDDIFVSDARLAARTPVHRHKGFVG